MLEILQNSLLVVLAEKFKKEIMQGNEFKFSENIGWLEKIKLWMLGAAAFVFLCSTVTSLIPIVDFQRFANSAISFVIFSSLFAVTYFYKIT